MIAPNFEDIENMTPGKIFQIDPTKKEPVNVMYGGSFLIATKYTENFVIGYLALVNDLQNIVRFQDFAFSKINWEDLEFVGQVEWFKSQ
jgi:hypothetical protein